MKTRINCFLFGHKFIRQMEDKGVYSCYGPSNWCINCGLFKNEIFKRKK